MISSGSFNRWKKFAERNLWKLVKNKRDYPNPDPHLFKLLLQVGSYLDHNKTLLTLEFLGLNSLNNTPDTSYSSTDPVISINDPYAIVSNSIEISILDLFNSVIDVIMDVRLTCLFPLIICGYVINRLPVCGTWLLLFLIFLFEKCYEYYDFDIR